MVVELPAQMVLLGDETVTTGKGFTVMVTDAVLVQPAADVPVTV